MGVDVAGMRLHIWGPFKPSQGDVAEPRAATNIAGPFNKGVFVQPLTIIVKRASVV